MASAVIGGSTITDPDVILGAIVSRSSSITELVIDGVTKLRPYAFYNLTGLSVISLPNLTQISGTSAFRGCSSLASVSLPNLTTLTSGCTDIFTGCSSLTNLTLPKFVSRATGTGSGSSLCLIGEDCSSFQTLTLGDGTHNITGLGDWLFIYPYLSLNLRLLSTNVVPYPGSLGGQGVTVSLYVPAGLVDSYKAASGWSDMASRIYAAS